MLQQVVMCIFSLFQTTLPRLTSASHYPFSKNYVSLEISPLDEVKNSIKQLKSRNVKNANG